MMLKRTEEESRTEAPKVRPLAPPAARDVSVVFLLERGRATAADLYRQYAPPLREGGYSFEFLFVFGPNEGTMRGAFTEEEEAHGEVRLLESGTIYPAIGDLVAYLCAVLTAAALAAALWRGRRAAPIPTGGYIGTAH